MNKSSRAKKKKTARPPARTREPGARYRIEPMLTAKEVGAMIGVVDRTLDRWMKEGIFPLPDVQIHRFRRWRRQTIVAWMRSAGRRIVATRAKAK